MDIVAKCYAYSVAAVLIFTSVVKFISAGQEVGFLTQHDPILDSLTNREIILGSAILEVIVAYVIFSSFSSHFKIAVIAWFATLLSVYRIEVAISGYRGPCSCLGGSLDWLTKNQAIAHNVPKYLLVYFLLSYAFLIFSLRKHYKSKPSPKCLILLFLLIVPINGHTQNLRIAGVVNHAIYDSNGSAQQFLNYNFEATINSNHWRIDTIWPDATTSKHGCDGASVFSLIGVNSTNADLGITPGIVTKGCYPLLLDGFDRFVWLAFASCSYLDKMTNNIMPTPWTSSLTDPVSYIYGIELERSTISPHFPIHIKFLVNKNALSIVSKNPNLRSVDDAVIREISKLPVKALGGEFVVKQTTNFNGIEIPSAFEMRQFVIPNGWCLAKWSGHVTAISTNQPSNFLPELPQNVSVSDFRFWRKDQGVFYINYIITNRIWLPETNQYLIGLFQAKLNKHNLPPTLVKHNSVFVFILSAMFCLPPIVIVIRTIWVRNNKITK